MNHVPNWWETILLGAAAFRCFRLAAWDTITDGLRYRFIARKPSNRKDAIGGFLQCAWCFGFWLALAWWAAWLVWPHCTMIVAVPFALSTLVGFQAHADS